MTQIMHAPGFQRLESLWRSVVFLLSRVEVKSSLRVYLVDVSKPDLVSDLSASDDPTQWALARLFLDPVSEHGEAIRWAGLIGAYQFGRADEDIPLLQRIGLLAEAAEIPWFSAGDPALFGCESIHTEPEPREWIHPVDPLWPQLRGNPEAFWIYLAFPPFLLRAPYGPEGERTKSFAFTESSVGTQGLLWGNPAVLFGIGIANAFAKSGWGLRLGQAVSVENVPVFGATEGWASPLQGLLSISGAERVRESGLTPVVAARNESVVRVQGIGSVASAKSAPKAWWIGDS
jgi:type VI secretion system protein ImpC